jgi:FAD dependent oxidoreductase
MRTQILVVGGGTGGVAAALGACALGMNVILTEETDWLGGQLTAQAVPPDENPWIETQGCTRRYRALREGVRRYYRENLSLTREASANPDLNPGGGYVSRLCFEPRVGVAVIDAMLQEFIANGRLTVLRNRKAAAVDFDRDRVISVELRNLQTGVSETIEADYFLDATELGDLLPLAKVEYVTGAESRRDTGEPHAVDGPAQHENVQAFTWCFPLAFDPTPGADHTIDKPAQYDRWRNYEPKLIPPYTGRLLDWIIPVPWTLSSRRCELFKTFDDTIPLFAYRQIVLRERFIDPSVHDVTLVNWPQNDYWVTNIIDKPAEVVARALEEAKQLSLSLVYWLQAEQGYRMLYLRPDITGTKDGLAKYPYIRESRRIQAEFTVTENHVATQARYGDNPTTNPTDFSRLAEPFHDSVGVGYYRIDLHPSTGGDNSIDIASLPFQIPLGALLPVRVTNLLPACKNIGTTHITNGCYRLHPVEWNIGESAGLLAAFCLSRNLVPRQVRSNANLLNEFQQLLAGQGVQLNWV